MLSPPPDSGRSSRSTWGQCGRSEARRGQQGCLVIPGGGIRRWGFEQLEAEAGAFLPSFWSGSVQRSRLPPSTCPPPVLNLTTGVSGAFPAACSFAFEKETQGEVTADPQAIG